MIKTVFVLETGNYRREFDSRLNALSIAEALANAAWGRPNVEIHEDLRCNVVYSDAKSKDQISVTRRTALD